METTPRSLDLIRQIIKDAINCASRFSCLLFSPHRSRSAQVPPQTTVLPEWKLHLCFSPLLFFLPFCFYPPHYFLIITKRGVFDIRLGRVRFARVLTKLYIPHTLYHINAHMQNMFLFETKWATRGAIGWGWLDGWGPRHRRKPFVGLSQ
ncbi:hypothetical protein CFAM422_002788 [Trichoderma lentiforme]|uniref:Uncharacterized protein n=1 Tax=Trichoderma lentiforme TaxID=1567552 RepID=A0A9P5CHP9_9HYPO|nr:hypothetical protein CFAM422_002788 [Trichoderma lentiforme]